jgi:hypothetical protein
MKIVRNDHHGFTHFSPHVDTTREDRQGVDIESCIDLIEKNILWIEERDLKELDTSLFPTRKSDEKITIQKVRSETKIW